MFPWVSMPHWYRRRQSLPMIPPFSLPVSAGVESRSVWPVLQRVQGIIREFWFFRAFSTAKAPESSRNFRSLRANSLLKIIREVNSAEQGKKFRRTGKELGRSGKAANGRVCVSWCVPVDHVHHVLMKVTPPARQTSAKSRAWVAQSIGMPSRRSRGTERSAGWRPSRMAACTLGARKASGMRVRM